MGYSKYFTLNDDTKGCINPEVDPYVSGTSQR